MPLKKLGRRALIISTLGSVLFLGFQNCGKAGFDSASTATAIATAASAPGSLSSIQAGSPFAFSASFDTIAYNSCFGSQLAGKAPYFTFRAGAYASGGARINKSFMDYARGKLHPSFPNTTVTSDQFKSLVATSAVNKDAQLIFAMRQQSNVQDAGGIYRAGTAPTVGVDYFNLLGPLTDDRWLSPMMDAAAAILDQPDYMQYFITAPRGFRNLEVNHVWNTDESLAQSIRSAFRGDAALTTTVQLPTGANGQSKAASTDVTKAYGTSFKLNFGVEVPAFSYSCKPLYDTNSASPTYNTWIGCNASGPDVNPQPDNLNPDNIVASIQEYDLETGNAAATTWNCSAKMRMMVVRPTDQAAICPRGEDAANIAAGRITDIAGYYADLEKIRRVLPADQWDVNLSRRCAVPKDADCYSSEKLNNVLVRVQYDVTKTCFQGIQGISYSGANPVETCAQFVTICTK